MNPESSSLPNRSPLLMSRANSALLVIDVQQKLVPAVQESDRLVWNIERLIDAATLLGIPIGATEQYPQGLGPTVPSISEKLNSVEQKVFFSCRQCEPLFANWSARPIRTILIAGMETHVCVQQTALDLLAQGFEIQLCVDAVSSRNSLDHDTALRRMEVSGVTLTTVEAALFEWCETSRADEFKAISQLVRKTLP